MRTAWLEIAGLCRVERLPGDCRLGVGVRVVQAVVLFDKTVHFAGFGGKLCDDVVDALEALCIVGTHCVGLLRGGTDLLAGGGKRVGLIDQHGVGFS